MKNNFSLKFKAFDVFIIIFSLVSIVASIVTTNLIYANETTEHLVVKVRSQNVLLLEKEFEFTDDVDEYVIVLHKEEYPHLLGNFTILINKDKGVCVKDVTCPNHYCEKMGWVNNVGYPIVCIPNQISVIMSNNEVDNDIVLG